MSTAAQHVLQTGLSSGMSAVSGIHSSKPNSVPASHDGSQFLLPANFTPEIKPTYTLKGKHSSVNVPPLAWGAWSWGDSGTWHWRDEEMPALQAAFRLAVSSGCTFIDNAQAYGSGRSEEIMGDLIRNHSGGVPRSDLQIQTKWYVVPATKDNLLHPVDAPLKYLKESLERSKLDYFDCYLVHGPIHPQSISNVAKGLAKCVDEGLTKAVGVANYSVEKMLEMQAELAKYGIPLATNQCEYSILRRRPETEGMLEACTKNGIVFQSYSSMGQGRLTGKYSSKNPPPKEYRFSSYPMEEIEPLLEVMKQIASNHGVSMAAVALNWNIIKGAIPVAGVRKEEQVKDNIKCFGWRLSNEEVKSLDDKGFEGKNTELWQQG